MWGPPAYGEAPWASSTHFSISGEVGVDLQGQVSASWESLYGSRQGGTGCREFPVPMPPLGTCLPRSALGISGNSSV